MRIWRAVTAGALKTRRFMTCRAASLLTLLLILLKLPAVGQTDLKLSDFLSGQVELREP